MDRSTQEALSEDVKRAAKAVAAQWPGVIGPDDAEQEIWMRLVESPGSAKKIIGEMNEKERFSSLMRIGRQVASQYRTDYDTFSGNYRYGVAEVKENLESGALSPEAETLSPERVDLGLAMHGLSVSQVRVLRKRYVYKEPLSSSERTALSRAETALTDGMNRIYLNRAFSYTEGPGTRRAMSNAAAIAATGKLA
jgi:hypothetical protein